MLGDQSIKLTDAKNNTYSNRDLNLAANRNILLILVNRKPELNPKIRSVRNPEHV